MEEPMSIERIAKKLGVNFYDLHPLITAREERARQEGRRKVVEWIEQNANKPLLPALYVAVNWRIWQDFKEGIGVT